MGLTAHCHPAGHQSTDRSVDPVGRTCGWGDAQAEGTGRWRAVGSRDDTRRRPPAGGRCDREVSRDERDMRRNRPAGPAPVNGVSRSGCQISPGERYRRGWSLPHAAHGVREDGVMSDAFTTRVLNIASGSRERVVDLTHDCEAFLREAAVSPGRSPQRLRPARHGRHRRHRNGCRQRRRPPRRPPYPPSRRRPLATPPRHPRPRPRPRPSRPRPTPRHPAGHCREAGTGDVAVGVPGGHQHLQCQPSGSVELPGLSMIAPPTTAVPSACSGCRGCRG